jgi:hypothetical protein
MLVIMAPTALVKVDAKLDVLIRHASLLWFELASSPSSTPQSQGEVGGLLVHCRSLDVLVKLAEKVAAGGAVAVAEEDGEKAEEEEKHAEGGADVEEVGENGVNQQVDTVAASGGGGIEGDAAELEPEQNLPQGPDSQSALLAAVRWATLQRWFRSPAHKDFLKLYLQRLSLGHSTPRANQTPSRFKLRRL